MRTVQPHCNAILSTKDQKNTEVLNTSLDNNARYADVNIGVLYTETTAYDLTNKQCHHIIYRVGQKK